LVSVFWQMQVLSTNQKLVKENRAERRNRLTLLADTARRDSWPPVVTFMASCGK
jgi:hypothetical protein